MVAQQTRVREDDVLIEVTPEQLDFYVERFGKIVDSGLINPHFNPPKKISE